MTDLAALPDHLLGPLFDAAAALIGVLPPAAVPPAARPLLGFDRRGLNRGPARVQLRRALDDDANFREQAFTVLREQPEITTVLEGWQPRDALAFANAAADRDELPLLACALVVAAPEGGELGLGVVVALDAQRQAARTEQGEAAALAARGRELEEGLRRAKAARRQAEGERDTLAERLRAEREARRGETRSAATTSGREPRVKELEAELERQRARADLLAAELESRLRTKAAPPAAPRRRKAPTPSARRARPSLPGGLVLDSAAAADAMLRSESVVLVVDGYNVSKSAWPAAALPVQRESLVRALSALHLTCGAEVIVVFDGDGTPGVAKPSRPGVQVVFSAPGVEADSVVVERVSATPLAVPVVVASSDGWVREHSETFGAVVISSATLIGVLRGREA